MSGDKTVKDVMIGIAKFPHMPYWFSIGKAVKIAKLSLFQAKEYPVPMAILVFDEKYNLMGTLTLEEILKGLAPKSVTQAAKDEKTMLSLLKNTLSDKEAKMLAERPVSEIMTPAKFSVDPGDPVIKAAYLMLQNNLVLLPVIDGKKKFVGLVRMIEVFDDLSNAILRE